MQKTAIEILKVLQTEIFSNFLCERFLNKSLSLEIVNFVNHLKEKLGRGQSFFTKSAFVQARNKVSPDVFLYLIKRLTDEFYTDNSNVKLILNGFRVLAVDGTCITLPTTRELEDL